MKSEWKNCTLGDCLKIIKTSVIPQEGIIYSCFSLPAFDNFQTPEVLDGKDIKSSKFVLTENTILFNKLNPKFRRVWNIHSLSQIRNPISSTEFLLLKVNEDVCQDFLYYYICSPSFTALMNGIKTGTSSSQQRIDWRLFLRQPIYLPPLPIQHSIAQILKAIDEKIAINRAIHDNLEQQAQALYLEWFTSRLGEYAEQYRKVSLADLMNYAGGSQPPASEFISEQRDGYVRFVQIRDYESNSHITYIPVSSKNKLCEEHDIMIARYGAALGRICFGLNGAYNVALAKVFPRQKYYREFLRCYLSSREFYEGINNKGGRSAQAGFNQSDIRSFDLFIPIDETAIQSFESLAAPIFEKRLHIIKENQLLATLRDTLLPKLISGELDVSAIEL